jgi:hypothetical protein
MNPDGRKWSIEPVLQLVFDGREGEALSAIRLELGESATDELRFLTASVDASVAKNVERPQRVRLANLYTLSVFLMDKECWAEAATALGWTIKLSEDMSELFFLEDARFRKALCHKMLGQPIAMLKEKERVSADKTFFVGDKVLGVGDLD